MSSFKVHFSRYASRELRISNPVWIEADSFGAAVRVVAS